MTDDVEPIGEGRFVVAGAVLRLTIERQTDFCVECARCGATWSRAIDWETIRAAYVVLPAQPSPLTYVRRIPAAKHWVEIAAGHVCMPRGYERISSSILRRIDQGSPRHEQLEMLSVILGELAIEAVRF